MKTPHVFLRIASKSERKENTVIIDIFCSAWIDNAKLKIPKPYTLNFPMANSPQFNSLQSSYTNTINNDDKSIIMSSMDEFKKMKVQVRRPLYFVVCCLVLLLLLLSLFHSFSNFEFVSQFSFVSPLWKREAFFSLVLRFSSRRRRLIKFWPLVSLASFAMM